MILKNTRKLATMNWHVFCVQSLVGDRIALNLQRSAGASFHAHLSKFFFVLFVCTLALKLVWKIGRGEKEEWPMDYNHQKSVSIEERWHGLAEMKESALQRFTDLIERRVLMQIVAHGIGNSTNKPKKNKHELHCNIAMWNSRSCYYHLQNQLLK